ncbi:hypothetical protein MES4922_230193 [Mesorhizobium ventifaucium]|uniref:Uncharacterized protein n=1 Tax=Mesorhizobium ventifaucium TaxID=666020 RepID=A0ABM9DU08_9HYPH|nr:hypothetical protein MES4922_230193 [Mesorhizobium ventifaucium]
MAVDRLSGFLSSAIRSHIGFDFSTLVARLEDVPSDPEDESDDHHHDFGTLKRVDRADVLEVERPAFHSIGRHCGSPCPLTI